VLFVDGLVATAFIIAGQAPETTRRYGLYDRGEGVGSSVVRQHDLVSGHFWNRYLYRVSLARTCQRLRKHTHNTHASLLTVRLLLDRRYTTCFGRFACSYDV